MKQFLLLFSLMYLFSCVTHSQGETGVIVIDKSLTNSFSDGPLPGVSGGPYRVYINGVLVDSSSTDTGVEFLHNAHIRDLNGNHFPFDTCRTFFIGDTLTIEFSEMNAISPDRIKVNIINKKYSICFVSFNSGKEIIATNHSLVLNKDIDKKGQVILGDIVFSLLDEEKNKQYSFRGSFICTIE
jgi:hypothetical protein